MYITIVYIRTGDTLELDLSSGINMFGDGICRGKGLEAFMWKLSDYKLGFADASKELLLQPEIFKLAFFDPKSIEKKLLESWSYILVGRKGVGKSAFNSRIQYLARNEGMIDAVPLMLDDFAYTTFAKANSDNDIEGTKKYYDAWSFLLLFQIYKYLYEELEITESEEFIKVIELLGKMGFPIKESFSNTVKTVSRLKTGANIGVFDIEYEQEFGHKPISFIERLSTVVDKMIGVLEEIYIPKKTYMLIDGVDDILRIKKNQVEILSSLLRSIERLNKTCLTKRINLKILIFLREDILSKASDPDLNKIKRDGYIPLAWSDDTDNLKRIAELRLNMGRQDGIVRWEDIFCEEVDEKNAWEAVLEHTLYKPRDILQFLVTCQELYPSKQKLLSSEIRKALKVYSREYFIEEMKNELSGYIDDDIINAVPSLFQRIGSKSFTATTLDKVLNDQLPDREDSMKTTKQLLLLLFESGYIGQLVQTNRNTESVVFKYRNKGANIDYTQKFLIHRGIQRGLGVRV